MNKETIVVGIAALVIGFLLGVLTGGRFTGASGQQTAGQQQSQVPVAGNIGHSSAKTAELEQVVAKDPANKQAWIALGNEFFDSNQAQKAVTAYSKALELDPDNANVLTDQGVMFRNLGFFDKALENFAKAGKVDPKHMQSLYNTGIVYAVDLKQPAKARETFELLIKKEPTGNLAEQAREMLKQLGASKP